MSDAEAYAAFRAVRFAENGGEPVCPHCGCTAVYTYEARRLFKCKACERQFTVTSGTIFASRKMPLRDILAAIVVFVNGANGVSALRLSRELCCSYKAAFVLAGKLRETMGHLRTPNKLTGVVEVDGVWIGGHIKPKNPVEKRKDRRKLDPRDYTDEEWVKVLRARERRRAIVTLRERRRGGRSLSFVCLNEGEAIKHILAHTDEGASIHSDKGVNWGVLHLHRHLEQVDHSREFVRDHVHVNRVESYNSRVRRGERGVYHRISGRHLQGYADEFAWREDYRRVSNGHQFSIVMRAAANAPMSREWKGYWQRRRADFPPIRPTMRVPG